MGGYTRLLPTEDRYLMRKEQFTDMLATALGGRVAEELTFDAVTTGASNDIENATNIARQMITRYGMSESLGPRTFGKKEDMIFLGRAISEQRDYSDKIAEEIDEEVHKLIQSAYEQATEILKSNKSKLAQIANYLVVNETVEGKELNELFESDPSNAEVSEDTI